MTDVFVSYKAEDQGRVAPLVTALEKDGLSVWWDAHIGGGDSWRETISEQLENARSVVVVWSDGSVGPRGQFVRDEATRALRRGTYVPVRIDPVEPPLGFGETQAIDLNGWKGRRSDRRYLALVAAVQARLGMEPKAIPTNATSEGISRRTAVVSGATAIVAAAGAGTWLFVRKTHAKSDTIAVLPFANLSGDPNESYFSDGIAEELRDALARIPGLKVIGRTSSEAVRNDDAETVAKKLGVASIVTGSVRRSPSMIRVNAELINGDDGVERWSQKYDRAPGDAIRVQTDIAENVVQGLRIALGRAEQAALVLGGTVNAAAQDFFLKARQARGSGTEDSYRREIALLDQAIALDPKFAAAYALKSSAVSGLTVDFGSKESWAAGYAEASALAREAIVLAPKLAAGYLALARNYETQLQFVRAFSGYERAAPLIGAVPADLITYGFFMATMGHIDEAQRRISTAISLDPLNPAGYGNLATTYYFSRQYPRAIQLYLKMLEQKPDARFGRAALCWSLMLSGRIVEARAECNRLAENDVLRLVTEAIFAARSGDHMISDGIVARMDKMTAGAAAYQDAMVYAQRRDTAKTLGALERAFSIRDPGLGWLMVEPLFDPVRADPAFNAFKAKLQFPR